MATKTDSPQPPKKLSDKPNPQNRLRPNNRNFPIGSMGRGYMFTYYTEKVSAPFAP